MAIDILKELGVSAEDAEKTVVVYYNSKLNEKTMERMQSKLAEISKRLNVLIVEAIDI